MRWSWLPGVCGLTMVLSACGLLPGASPTTPPSPAAATTVPSTSAPAPSPTRPQAAPTASPVPSKPAATAAPAPSSSSGTVYVGNTDGEGVYVRKTPVMADRLKPYADGTPLTVVGDDVDGDGQHWKHIKTPDGLEGYVPSIYTVESPP